MEGRGGVHAHVPVGDGCLRPVPEKDIWVLIAGQYLSTTKTRSQLEEGENSDVDPDWLYPDPDRQNLINPDPDPGQ